MSGLACIWAAHGHIGARFPAAFALATSASYLSRAARHLADIFSNSESFHFFESRSNILRAGSISGSELKNSMGVHPTIRVPPRELSTIPTGISPSAFDMREPKNSAIAFEFPSLSFPATSHCAHPAKSESGVSLIFPLSWAK